MTTRVPQTVHISVEELDWEKESRAELKRELEFLFGEPFREIVIEELNPRFFDQLPVPQSIVCERIIAPSSEKLEESHC
ncbi:unnamed protein product [Allacma fusca]|uniref:Uncharacterized protein n=1 Tax=Allacma fusca TaxID=39272 RepID=A0A8J2NW97_9HEXA|nr:unnamed protein product [Allacma fusca]